MLMRSTRSAPARTGVGNASAYRVSLALSAVTCALAPAYTIRWHLGGLPTTVLENALLLTFLVFACETVGQRTKVEVLTPFTLPAFLFILAGALAVAVAPDRRAALGLYRAYLLEPVAFFFVLSTVVRSLARARLVLGGLAVGALIVAVANIMVDLAPFLAHSLEAARPVAIYNTPNAVPLFLGPLIGLAAALVAYERDSRFRAAGAIFLAVTVVACFLTLSRGGLFALAAVAIGLALTARWRLLLAATAVAAAVLLTLVPPFTLRFIDLLNHFVNPSFAPDSRVSLWRATLPMLRDHPLFGAGLSGFSRVIRPYLKSGAFSPIPIYPHNILLNVWTETGLLGVVAFGWLLVEGARVSWRGWRRATAEWRPLHLGVLLALVAVVVHGLVDVPYFKNDLSLEFWTLLGLTWAATRWGHRREPVEAEA